MTIGEKLKEARKQAGLSQEQLSEKLGVSRCGNPHAARGKKLKSGIGNSPNVNTKSNRCN